MHGWSRWCILSASLEKYISDSFSHLTEFEVVMIDDGELEIALQLVLGVDPELERIGLILSFKNNSV